MPSPKKTEPRSDAAAQPAAEPALSKHQAFTMQRVHRSQLATAAYNPRTISEPAKAKLKKNLKRVGLLEPLIWNRTTGTLLGGHQRLACLDALEGRADYLLDVAAVELTEAEEREQNVALNNPTLQGSYDLDLLADLLKTPELDLEMTGLTVADVQVMFDDDQLASLFVTNEATDAALSEVEEQTKAAKKAAKAQATTERREKLKREGGASTDDTENYAVAVFHTREQREAFVALLGYPTDERYVDGPTLHALIAAPVPAAAPPEAGRSDRPGNVSSEQNPAAGNPRGA